MRNTAKIEIEGLDPVSKLNKDLLNASITLTDKEARFFVDAYYMMQDSRIRTAGQIRSMSEEPHIVLSWLMNQNEALEDQVKKALDRYSANHTVGKWMRSQKGIGPVIAAGFLAHIDIKKCPTAGHIWSFAGYDPNREWIGKEVATDLVKSIEEEHGKQKPEELLVLASAKINRNIETIRKMSTDKQGKMTRATIISGLAKRPWNAALKTLCWKAGESFVKVSGDEDALYGQIYKNRKAYEIERNEAGGNAEAAKAKLEKYNIGKDTDAYKAYSIGKLPPAHIQARSTRYAVKMFLSHLHDVWYRHEYGTAPPKPFAIAILGHAHYIEVPK